jgi:hypothetical protein
LAGILLLTSGISAFVTYIIFSILEI